MQYAIDDALAPAILSQLQRQQKTLAFAESCTGGFLAHLITRVPGASQVFMGSLVVYSSSWKESLLSVSQSILDRGVVSEEAVLAMLQGIWAHTHADVGVAVSGILGPTGATADIPIGTVYLAIGEKESHFTRKLSLQGTRDQMIVEASCQALRALQEHLTS